MVTLAEMSKTGDVVGYCMGILKSSVLNVSSLICLNMQNDELQTHWGQEQSFTFGSPLSSPWHMAGAKMIEMDRNISIKNYNIRIREFPSDSVVRTLFSLPRARVQYLVREPRSHKSFDLAKGENKYVNKCFLKRISMTQLFYNYCFQ